MVDFEEQRALLRLSGDEDRVTQGKRRWAFHRAARSQRDVVVDLSDLAFADTSLMVDLAVLARRLRACGCALRLLRPQPQIRRLIELVRLDRLPSVALLDPPLSPA